MGGMELIDAAMDSWAPDTRHYLTADGLHLAVHVDADFNEFTADALDVSLEAAGMPTFRSGVHTVVLERTQIFACTEDGAAITLDALHDFEPGTSHEDALAQAGYT